MKETKTTQAARHARAGRFAEAVKAAVGLTLPKGLEVFFPASDGRQDLIYEQDFGLERDLPAFRRARRALAAARLPSGLSELLCGYTDLFTGDYARAEKSLAAAAAAFPGDYWPRFLHAAALWLQGDKLRTRDLLPDALEVIDRAIALDPRQKYAYVIRAGLKREMEDVPGRLKDAETVIKLDPRFVWARTERAEVLGETGRYAPAKAEVDALIRRFPKEAWSWAQRARLNGISGKYEAALADFDKAAELDPRCGPLIAWRAETKRRLGRYQDALDDLDRAVDLDPGYRGAWAWRGRIKLLLGRTREAVRDFDRCLKLEPREMLARAWRAQAYFLLGDAERCAREYQELHPAGPHGNWNRRLGEGQTQETTFMLDAKPGSRLTALFDDLAAARAARPGDAWVWAFSGRCRVDGGQVREGLAELTRALELDPRNDYARAWRGETVRRMGAPKKALEDLTAAGGERWARVWRAQALADLGRPAEALAEFDAALDTPEQRFAPAHVARGETLWKLGRRAEAAEAFRRAFRLDGKCHEAEAWHKKTRKLLAA